PPAVARRRVARRTLHARQGGAGVLERRDEVCGRAGGGDGVGGAGRARRRRRRGAHDHGLTGDAMEIREFLSQRPRLAIAAAAAAASSRRGGGTPGTAALAGAEVKKPGAAQWTLLSDFTRAAAILRPKCPDGAGDAKPLEP